MSRVFVALTAALGFSACTCLPNDLPLFIDAGTGGGFAGGGGSGGGGAAGGAGGGFVTYDAGPDIDGGAAECAEALNGAQSGDPCTFSRSFLCLAQDFACGASAWCGADGGLTVSRGCYDAGTFACTPFPSGTLLAGTTPLGAIDFRSSWGSPSWGFLRNLILQFGSTPTAERALNDSLGIETSIDPHDAGLVNIVYLALDGGHAYAPATVTLNRVDQSRVWGTVTITAPGWSVSGTFDAPLCAELDRSGS